MNSNSLARGVAAATTAFLAFMFNTAVHAETRYYYCKGLVDYDSNSKPSKIANGAATTFTVEKGWFSSSVKMNDSFDFNIVEVISPTTVAATLRLGSVVGRVSLIHTSGSTADFSLYKENGSDRGVITGTCSFQIK